jgi:hypothetical protein
MTKAEIKSLFCLRHVSSLLSSSQAAENIDCKPEEAEEEELPNSDANCSQLTLAEIIAILKHLALAFSAMCLLPFSPCLCIST